MIRSLEEFGALTDADISIIVTALRDYDARRSTIES